MLTVEQECRFVADLKANGFKLKLEDGLDSTYALSVLDKYEVRAYVTTEQGPFRLTDAEMVTQMRPRYGTAFEMKVDVDADTNVKDILHMFSSTYKHLVCVPVGCI